MKWKQLLLLAPAVGAVTPLQKVVQLLEEMSRKGLKEKQEEEVRFAKFSQWCEDTEQHKADDVKEGAEKMEQLEAQIAKHGSTIENLSQKISTLDDEIATWQSDQKAASDVRGKEKSDYTATHTDYSESITAIDKAISVLKQQDFDRAQASLLQVAKRTRVPDSAKRQIAAFLQSDPEVAFAQQEPAANAYEFQSGGVIDMLKELQTKFTDEQRSLERAETEAAHAYESLSQDLSDQISNGKKTNGQMSEQRGKTAAKKADAEGELHETTKNHDEDSKYLQAMQVECKLKHEEFDRRNKLRGDELDQVAKAVDILNSQGVKGSAEANLPTLIATSFVQVHSRTKSASRSIQDKVAAFLQSRATKFSSNTLSLVAEKVSEDPFGKVKKMIQNMISKLMAEATAETEHKGWCDGELGSNKITRESKSSEVEELTAERDELKSKIAKNTQDAADLQAQISNLDKAVAEATAQREENHQKNTTAIKEAKEAQAGLSQAIAVLKEFYEKAEASFVQLSSQRRVSQPELGAPETFEGEYKGMQGLNGNIMNFLEVIQSDFVRLEAETTQDEEQEADEHKKFLNESEISKATKNATIENHNSKVARLNADLANNKQDLTSTQKELDAATKYFDELKPSCLDAGISYEERVARREEEIQSLKEALEILQQ